MFASQTTDTVSLTQPDGTVNVVTVQKLNWKRLQDASDRQSEVAVAKAAKAGPEVGALWERQAKAAREEAEKSGVKKEPTLDEKRESRYRGYDKETVLLHGVRSWTSPVDLAQGLADLDEDAAEKLHRKILDMSLPPLTVEEATALKGEG